MANKRRTWGHVVFTDRKKFLFQCPGSKVKPVHWDVPGKSTSGGQVYQPNHPQCVNVYAGISKYGTTKVHVVAGTSKHKTAYKNKRGEPARNITSSAYRDVLNGTLLPSASEMMNSHGIGSWVFQQDNDPTHGCAKLVIMEWNKKPHSNVQLLPNWPPNSPDLNILENVWAYVQQKVNARGGGSFDAFKEAVISEIKSVPRKVICNLYASLPKRMAAVIANDGGKTKY